MLVALSVLLWIGPSTAQGLSEIESYTLPNGLDVRLERDPSKASVALALSFDVGARDDPPGRAGLAHLMEHLFFRGARRPREHHFLRTLEAAGAVDLRGYTRPERTVLLCSLPSTRYPTALWLFGDTLAFLLRKLDARALGAERAVIENERALRRFTLPVAANVNLYPSGHAYRYHGDADVGAIELEEVQAFFQRWYGPNNATLALVGNFEVEAARAHIQHFFGSIRNSGPVPRRQAPSSARPRVGRDLRLRHPGLFSDAVLVAWVTPGRFQAGDAELELLASALNGPNSPLEPLVDRRVIETVRVGKWTNDASGALVIEATPWPGVSLDEVSAAINAAIGALAAHELSDQRFELLRRARSVELSARLDHFSERAAHPSEFGWPLELERERLRDLSARRLRATAARVLRAESRLIVRLQKSAR